MIFCSWVTRGLRPAEGRVAVPAQGENRPPSGSVSETNNECQIKCKLLHLDNTWPAVARARTRSRMASWPALGILTDAAQLRQHQRVTAVRLHPIARFDRDHRRRHHDAIMPTTSQ
jgi:hypothetical protein